MKMLSTVISYTLQFSTPFILALILLLCLLVAWFYSIFLQTSNRTSNKSFGYEFSNETQVALAIFVVSLFFVVAISTYGIYAEMQEYQQAEISQEVSTEYGAVCSSRTMDTSMGKKIEDGWSITPWNSTGLRRRSRSATKRYSSLWRS